MSHSSNECFAIYFIELEIIYGTFFLAIGVLTAAVGYGVYAFKNKGKMSTSVYLMHLRVGAQGAAVGSLTLGLLYTMINQHILHKKD